MSRIISSFVAFLALVGVAHAQLGPGGGPGGSQAAIPSCTSGQFVSGPGTCGTPSGGTGNVLGTGSTTSGNLLQSNNTGSPLATATDTGIATTNVGTLSGTQTFSGAKTFSSTLNVTGTLEVGGSAIGFSNLAGTATAAQLPVGTNSAEGIVKADGSTTSITGGVISSTASAPTTTIYSSATTPFTLSASNNQTVVVTTTAVALTGDLPASPATNLTKCVQDGGTGFSKYPFSLETTDGTAINGIPGGSPFLLTKQNGKTCATFNGTQWNAS